MEEYATKHPATLHCAFIVAEELELVGAGSEGWIDDPSLVMAMSASLLAVARLTTVVIVALEDEQSKRVPRPVVIRLPTVEDEPRIKAMEWLIFDKLSVLAVGTTQGTVLMYSTNGSLLLKQNFQASPVLRLRVRRDHNKSSQHGCLEELCIVYPKAIVRIDAADLQPLLHRFSREAGERMRKGKTTEVNEVDLNLHRLTHQLWNVSKAGGTTVCVDGAIAGVMPSPLLEHQSRQRYFCAITVGPDCAIAAYRLSEDKSSSLTNIIMKKVVPATVSTISMLTKILWRSNDQQVSDSRPTEVKPQDYASASLITSLKDYPRKGERIALSPSGTLAAVTDSLGRILLLDTQALVVIRLWKGYRDASCYFLEVREDYKTGLVLQRARHEKCRKQDLVLCLAIHAPRRGVVEIWKLRNGPRMSIVQCGKGWRILQPSCRFRCSEIDLDNHYRPSVVYLFNGDSGQLSVLNFHISVGPG
eukprot:c24920_g1_i1 orf=88-1509(-)